MTTLVCLPGLLCEPEVFDPMRAVLPQQEGAPVDMRVLPLPGGDDFAALARSLAADIPDGAVLLGMSMGSYLALRVALTHPGKLAGLVLIGTNAAADTPDAAAMRGKVARWAAREGMEALAASLADSLVAPARRSEKALRERIVRMALAQGVARFTEHQKALAARPDQRAALGGLTCPLLVLCGTEDGVTPLEAGRALAEAVPEGRCIALPGTGHLAVLEAPQIVAGHLAEFLTRIATNTKEDAR
ncbi:MAG: alpha/beta hydrolase [Proteobacteria bacterium]|nr:alpha/beta hydrolase [Pseudomonadota bacterium]